MNKFLILLGSLFVLTFFSCNDDGKEDDLLDTLENEKSVIHEYLSQITTPILYLEYYSVYGMLIDTVFIFNYDGSGEVAKDSGWALIDYEKYFLGEDKKIDTTTPVLGDTIPTYAYGGPILYHNDTVRKYDYIADALRHISVGDMGGEMIIPSILAGNEDRYGRPLHYKLKAHKLIDNVKENEEELIQRYISDILRSSDEELDYPDSVQSDTVTHTVFLRRGTGDRTIQVGDSVLMVLANGLLDDVGVDNREIRMIENDTVKILYNETWQKKYPSGMIKGFQRLREGDVASIVVPYGMAYGAAGTTGNTFVNMEGKSVKQYLIPPYSTLWYNVEVWRVIPPKTEEE